MRTVIKLRMFFWRWHRRLGLTSALVLALLCITGFFLNHSVLFNLHKSAIHSKLLLALYGIEVPRFSGIKIQNKWISAVGDQIYSNDRHLHECEGGLVGAITLPNTPTWVAACEKSFLIFTHEDVLVEVIGKAHGMSLPIQSLGHCEQHVCYTANQKLYRADFESLEWQAARNTPYTTTQLQNVPPALQNFYQRVFIGDDLTWERVIQDIHAARFLGDAGPWLLDIFAVFFLFLSGSGFYLWYSQSRRLRQ